MTNTYRENGLLSPARSDVSAMHVPPSSLPVPRSHPIPPGSSKETAVINFIDARLLNITRRYAKSFAANQTDRGTDSGYTDFSQVIADLDSTFEVIWITGTPSIQVPYLLALAGHFRGYMHSFPFLTASFALARKFDSAFAALLLADSDSVSRPVNTTDKVRIRSLVQETRYEMIDVASKSGHSVQAEEVVSEDEEIDSDTDATDEGAMSSDQSIATSLGKVYEKTLDILGGDLSSLPPPAPPREPPPSQIGEDIEIIDL